MSSTVSFRLPLLLEIMMMVCVCVCFNANRVSVHCDFKRSLVLLVRGAVHVFLAFATVLISNISFHSLEQRQRKRNVFYSGGTHRILVVVTLATAVGATVLSPKS